jgi:leader peptidase (prepilin peptidase)/N-methyltransferase
MLDVLLTAFVYLLVFALGASVGSFLSVVIHRIPAGISILVPPSRCPMCHHHLQWQENVPIVSWIRLKGCCSSCHTAIPVRYPLLEAVCGTVFLALFWMFGVSWQTVGYWIFFSWLLGLSLIDIDTMTLPNALTQSGLVAGLIIRSGGGAIATASWAAGLTAGVEGVVGAVVGLWLLDMIAFVGSVALGQTAMGGGDAKLAAMMGAWLGWQQLLLAGFLACVVGAFAGGGAIAIGLLSRRQPFPFGPFLALGGLIAAIWGQAIVHLYVQTFFPTL